MTHEPIAIVGIGCRFPGAPDAESFWRVLRDGIETVGEYPGGRFHSIDRAFSPDAVKRGMIATRRGGFLPSLDQFDAEFFGISPREAVLLDPQQRLLLEVAWEAAEDAGIPLGKLSGSKTGVYVGLWNSDYERCIFEHSRDLDFYATTGGGRYPASGRLAYFLDLRGPNLTVDTACSSSLVAVHLACASLRSGESEMALAGGVNVIMSPEITLSYSAAKMLSTEGRCKFGDAAADGYARSEGAGIVFLKTLSRALDDGDSIYALIRGSAVNNDGRSSGSLIAPSREGQEDMLRKALRDAGVAPQEIDYIEAHGTGTLAGDPVEIAAISNVVASESRTQPCLVGSVKTNFGHTESAAGAAGLIKVALSLTHGAIPASLHFREPNPRIDWSRNVVAVPNKTTPWPARAVAPIGGVSGFGITGTNAHVILQGAPQVAAKLETRGGSHIFLLSACTPQALEARAKSWRDRLLADARWPASLADLAYTANVRRSHHDHRLAFVAGTRQELFDRINGWLAKQEQSGARSGKRLAEENRRAVFVFPGQGGQWFGMGRALLRDEPVFQKALTQCDEAIRKFTGWSVVERLTQADAESALAGIDVIQPVLFAVMVSLAQLWRSFGVEPQAVVGHSMGEAAAAAVCGALSLEDAAAVICHRSRLMKIASGRGLMAVAELSLEDAEKFVRDYEGRISVAANNSPTSTVLSGDADAIEDALTTLEAREIFCRRIKVDVASHSAHMEPFREELARLLKDIRPRNSSIPLYSTTSGAVEDGTALNADYWSRNLRQPVLFSSAMQSLLADGFDTFIEVNAHPVLLQSIEDGIRHAQKDAVAVASLRRDKDERPELLDALGALYVSGFPIDLTRLHPQGVCLRLPAYPWQRERYWMEESDGLASRGQGTGAHANLGVHIASSVKPGAHLWEINLRTASGSGDAAPLLIELAIAAASEALGAGSFTFEDLNFPAPSSKDHAGQLVLEPSGKGGWSLRISAKTESGWSARCVGSIRRGHEETNGMLMGEFRERELEDHEREPLRECFKFAAKAFEERNDPGPYRVSKVGRLVWQDVAMQGKRAVRAALAKHSEGLQAACQLELQGGTLIADAVGLQFEMEAERNGLGCTYQLKWTAGNVPTSTTEKRKSWMLLAEAGALSDHVIQHFKSLGDDCVRVTDAQAARRALESSGLPYEGVIHLPRSGAVDARNTLQEASEIVALVQALAGVRHKSLPPRLWLVTTGAWDLAGDAAEIAIAQGSAWGLGRVISAEYPEWRCANLDLSSTSSAGELDVFTAWLRADGSEEQIAIRGNASFVARLERRAAASSSAPIQLSPDATYLITGGLGGVGLKLARWMVGRGARSIALIGRRAPSETALEEIKNMEYEGAAARVFSADVADENQTAAVLHAIAKEMPPLRGVFHLAAVMDSTLLTEVNAEQLQRAMRPKADGAWTLHHLTQNLALDHFVLFSSMTAIIGQPGVASYAAANSALDALARYRQSKGLKAISIQWGPWADLGLTKTEKARRGVDMYAQQGIRALSFDETFDALSQLLQQDLAGAFVAPIQWQKFARSFSGDAVPRTFASLIPSAGEASAAAPSQQVGIRESLLAALPGRSRRALLEGHLQEVLAGVLKTSATRLDPVKPLGSMGVDSLMALQFVRQLAVTTSVRLPATAVFNYPTLRVLAAEIARRMGISLDAVVLPASVPQNSENLSGVSPDVASLTEEETIQALLQGGGD